MEDFEKNLENQLNNLPTVIQPENILVTFTKIKISKLVNDYQIHITIPNDLEKENYFFVLEITFSPIKLHLYVKNIFPYNDLRDLYPILCYSKTQKSLKNDLLTTELDVIETIKQLKDFPALLKSYQVPGLFYLNFEYNHDLIKSLFSNTLQTYVRNIEIIRGKIVENLALILISDEYFLMFDLSKLSDKKANLKFFGSLKCLISFKKSIVGNMVTVVFKSGNKEGKVEVVFTSNKNDELDLIMDTLIEKIKKFGFRMDIYQKKQGQLPKINIEKVEKDIIKYEAKVLGSGGKNDYKNLLNNFELAIEYYSAVNNPKYKTYNEKMQMFIKDERFQKFL